MKAFFVGILVVSQLLWMATQIRRGCQDRSPWLIGTSGSRPYNTYRQSLFEELSQALGWLEILLTRLGLWSWAHLDLGFAAPSKICAAV